MQVEWYGQSAFRLTEGETTVAIDPFGDMSSLAAGSGVEWEYPAIDGLEASLLLITHEHRDHNAVDVVGGEPAVLRSTAGTLDSPLGPVVAIASEHDAAAGTERGPNTIFAFDLGGLRVAHMGDFGQRELRDEQAAALGGLDLLIIPVGAGPTIGAQGASAIVERLAPRWVMPMHYRTPRIGFLEDAEAFLSLYDDVRRLESPVFEPGGLADGSGPAVIVPAAP